MRVYWQTKFVLSTSIARVNTFLTLVNNYQAVGRLYFDFGYIKLYKLCEYCPNCYQLSRAYGTMESLLGYVVRLKERGKEGDEEEGGCELLPNYVFFFISNNLLILIGGRSPGRY